MAEFLKVPDAAACIDVKNIYNLKKKIKTRRKKMNQTKSIMSKKQIFVV